MKYQVLFCLKKTHTQKNTNNKIYSKLLTAVVVIGTLSLLRDVTPMEVTQRQQVIFFSVIQVPSIMR